MKNKMEVCISILAGFLFFSGCSAANAGQNISAAGTEPTLTQTLTPTATIRATEIPTPTQESKFTVSWLSFVPKEIGEITASVEVRSPIDDPAGYKADVTNVLKVINEQILPNYSGDFIESGIHMTGMAGIDPDRGCILFRKGTVFNPVAAVYFEWNGYNVPILFFPAKDSQGSFALGLALSPTMNNSDHNNNNPAQDWRMSELIKVFPMTITSGWLEVRYSNAGVYSTGLTAGDPFYSAYFANRESDEYNAAVWNFFIRDEGFDRNFEYLPFVVLGGE
jgi:hypothetical protein